MEYMTEEEAKGKWCPMRGDRMDGDDGNPIPRYACCTSHCMCWREERDDYGEGYADLIKPGRGRCGMVR